MGNNGDGLDTPLGGQSAGLLSEAQRRNLAQVNERLGLNDCDIINPNLVTRPSSRWTPLVEAPTSRLNRHQ